MPVALVLGREGSATCSWSVFAHDLTGGSLGRDLVR